MLHVLVSAQIMGMLSTKVNEDVVRGILYGKVADFVTILIVFARLW